MKLPKPVGYFLLKGDTPINNLFGAYGYLLITSRPNVDYKAYYNRLLIVAQSYLDNFPIATNDDLNKDPVNLMITHWMIRTYPFPQDQQMPGNKSGNQVGISHTKFEPTAKQLLTDYDFDRALPMLSSIRKLDVAGPVLVAWEKPFEKMTQAERENRVLIIDFSRFCNEDIRRAILIWRQMICEDAGEWSRLGNKFILFREQMRNTFQMYGSFFYDFLNKK